MEAAVIGAAGRMGAWLAAFLSRHGYSVLVSDKNKLEARRLAERKGYRFIEDYRRAAQSAQLILLATPPEISGRILDEVANQTTSKDLLVEICSIKEPLKATLKSMRRRGIPVLSIHPMFGPGVNGLKGKTVLAITPHPNSPLARRLLSHFRHDGARIVKCSINEHDRLMSFLLTLPHFINILFADTLRLMDVNLKRLRELSGTTFKLQLLMAETILQESRENEVSILTGCKASLDSIKSLMKAANSSSLSLMKRDEARILRRLIDDAGFFRGDVAFKEAYRRFNAAVEAANQP